MGDRIAGFLNKKPWHPSSFRNQEKTWLAEQRAEKEEAALRERRAEIKKEKEEEESRSGGGWVAAADNPVRKPASAAACVEINQCVGCSRQFFTKSFLGDDVAVLARVSGEEPASPRHRAGGASMASRTTRRFSTNAP